MERGKVLVFSPDLFSTREPTVEGGEINFRSLMKQEDEGKFHY
jgi:hypothetical protein